MKPTQTVLPAVALVWALVGVAVPARSQTTASATSSVSPAPSKSTQLDIDGSKQWVDTKIDLRAGEKIHVTATGTITYPAGESSKSKARSFGPDGLSRSFADLIHQYAVPDAGHGALVGRLGTADDGGQPFLLGSTLDFEAPVANRLFLGINQSAKDGETAQGSFHVTIEIVSAGSSTNVGIVGGPAESRIAGITPALLREIPRRVSDQQGNAGDMVNILLIGTEEQVTAVFKAAGWVHVDSSVEEAAITGLLDSLEKKDYLTMPMSTLYLFNRPQDYGFAHAEPVRVVMSRNHLRIWKSPYSAGEKTIWCVAATHDVGFERDQRNNNVTHKIDPAIDGEREFVNNTLSSTGLVTARDHVTPPNALTSAKTATGGEFHSDGRVLVLVLKSAASADEAKN